MKTKAFIFMLFLCSLIFISIVAIEPSKDGTQLGAIEKFKTKAPIDHTWRPWGGGWVKRGRNGKGGAGGKIGGHGSSGSSSGGNAGEEGAQGGGEQDDGGEEKESGVDGGGKLENNKKIRGI
ncbi:hypothetical protein TSUD_374170 [Trifolium subterraneum]|uniref:Glycine-rich protein n=1 Tax=Trifolium subterraneum TaxID=3900 RepID=A0A2Z6NY72_TRISU|nr:hypothetical protein TSUD_374170 [Trifolium subterraneum]